MAKTIIMGTENKNNLVYNGLFWFYKLLHGKEYIYVRKQYFLMLQFNCRKSAVVS